MSKRYEAAEIVEIGLAEELVLGADGVPSDNALGYGDKIPVGAADLDE